MRTVEHTCRHATPRRPKNRGSSAASHADLQPGLTVTLLRRQFAVVTARCRVTVRCLHDGLWITEPPRFDDNVLQPGHPCFELEEPGKLVISAFSNHPFVTLKIAADRPATRQRWCMSDAVADVHVDILQA